MMKNDTLPPDKQRQQKEYNDYVKQVTPTYSLWGNMAKAFVVTRYPQHGEWFLQTYLQ